MSRVAAVLVMASMVAACNSVPTSTDEPAQIVNPDDASRASLLAAVESAAGGRVTLADDALTSSSVLTIEQRAPATLSNPAPYGRVLERSMRFRLVVNAGSCVLIDEREQVRYPLRDVRCEPVLP